MRSTLPKAPDGVIFYDLPEDGAKKEEYKNKKGKLENLWDSFKFNLDSPEMLRSEEIIIRSKEISKVINEVEKVERELNIKNKGTEYSVKLAKRKQLVHYIEELNMNNSIDSENIMDEDFEQEPTVVLADLKKNKLFWRNLGTYYNKQFEKNFNWELKRDAIQRQMEDERKQMNGKHDDDEVNEEKEDNKEEVLLQDSIQDDYRIEDNHENVVQVHKKQENEVDNHQGYQVDEEEERRYEQQMELGNLDLEEKIRQLEREKRNMEVS